MSATTRWVQYSISAAGSAGDGGTNCLGTRAYAPADGTSDKDSFNIASGSNRLHFTMHGVAGTPYITLTSGTNLDPRFVARDITEKMHALGGGGCDHAQCVWENGKLVLYSGDLGSSAAVAVVSGTNTAHLELGWASSAGDGGHITGNVGNWGVTISGTYNGFFDETYKIVINKETTIGAVTKLGSNSYLGTMTPGGAYNHNFETTYTLNIAAGNGSTMGGGTGNVPTLSWTASPSDDGGPIELLYADYWYKVGSKGLMVKFSEGVFNTCAAYTIVCKKVEYAYGSQFAGGFGSAMYFYGSTRGDDATNSITCKDDDLTQLGTRGLTIKFVGSANATAGDEFYVICKPPQPMGNITNVNYGNVTVSTESPVKAVMFEIVSGAVEISTVKFGLQSHGTFEHHNEVNSDTYFRFGTVGPGQPAGAPSATDGLEWRQNVAASDIASDTPPAYLYATKENLSVVADADDSENIGASVYMGMTSDPIFINVRLGASEVGANSLINQRIYFDYS